MAISGVMAGVMAAAKREGFSTFQRAAKRAFARLRNDLETSALVSQVRSTAIDLLRVAGMDSSEALEALREATRLGSGE